MPVTGLVHFLAFAFDSLVNLGFSVHEIAPTTYFGITMSIQI